jgi:hypothetical protein
LRHRTMSEPSPNIHHEGTEPPSFAPALGHHLSAAMSGHLVRSCSVRLLRCPVLVRRHPQGWLTPAS